MEIYIFVLRPSGTSLVAWGLTRSVRFAMGACFTFTRNGGRKRHSRFTRGCRIRCDFANPWRHASIMRWR